MRTIQREIVGAFIFSNDNQVLLVQSAQGGVYQDAWVVAGGGIEPGETFLDAVIREVSEELALDIRADKIVPSEDVHYGQSTKTLRDTGEEVLVKMLFQDFMVYIDKPAASIPCKAQDDIEKAQWFSLDELKKVTLGPATEQRLSSLGYIK